MSDVIHRTFNQIYLWEKSKAGLSLVGTKIGQLLLTDERLIFLSTGTSGLTKQVVASLFLGTVGGFVLGKTSTDELDLSALKNEGSFSIPLSSVKHCEAKRRLDFAMYLSLRFTDEDGTEKDHALMTKTGFQWKETRAWAQDINDRSS